MGERFRVMKSLEKKSLHKINPFIKISDIKIRNRFRKDFGELDKLVSSIKEIGLLHPIVIDEDHQLVAGQRRLESCKKLGWIDIPVHIVNLQDLTLGEFHENHVRKNFTKSEILSIKNALHPKLKQQGKRTDLTCGDSPQVDKDKKTRDIISEYTGLSSNTIKKLEEIKEEAKTNPKFAKLFEAIDNNENKTTTNSVYLKLQKLKKKRAREKWIKKNQTILPDSVNLYNCEFQRVPIQENSVSLIFTDPPYHDQYLYLYEDLAKEAAKILKDGGSLITFVGQKNIPEICNIMSKYGLTFHWPIVVVHSGPSATVHASKTMVAWKPMLWFTKGKYEGDYVSDLVKSTKPDKGEHEWAQSTAESDYYIEHTTVENEIVYDPFLGSGTFGISAVKLNRQFIGAEIDSEYFQTAQRLLSISGNTNHE